MSLSVAPLIPLWLVLTLAGLGLAIALATIIARRRGGLLRLGATILMALALLNPSMVREEREKLKDVAVILVDRSGSQNLSVRPGQTDVLKADIANRLGRSNDLELRIVDIGETEHMRANRPVGINALVFCNQANARQAEMKHFITLMRRHLALDPDEALFRRQTIA